MKDFLNKELPILLLGVFVSVITIILLFKYVPFLQPRANVVSFDVVKLANAQRKLSLASNLNPDTDILVQLKRVGTKTQKIISEVAGPNTIVVVKQAVVSQVNVPDITDEVLKRLDLPTNVKSADVDTPSELIGDPDMSKIKGKLESFLIKPKSPENAEVLPE